MLDMSDIFQFIFVKKQYIFINAAPDQLEDFCLMGAQKMLDLQGYIGFFDKLVLVSALGYLTAIVQKFMIFQLKDNVQLPYGQIALEVSMVLVAACYEYNNYLKPRNSLVSGACIEGGYIDLNADQIDKIDYIFAILSKTN
jgi:hypothetical protein